MDDFMEFVKQYTFTRGLVAGAHANHTYGDKPFVYHLNCVENEAIEILLELNIKNMKAFADVKIIAQLHDLVEDTSFTYEQLKELGYSDIIIEAVRLVTDPEGETRAEKKKKLVENLHNFEGDNHIRWMASIVKIADRLHNQGSTYSENNVRRAKMYLREWPDFKESFVMYAALPNSILTRLHNQIENLKLIVDEHENSPVQYAV